MRTGLAALTLVMLAPRAAAAAAADPSPVELLFHADLGGQLAQPACGKATGEAQDYAMLAAAVRRLRDEAAAAGRAAPVVLLGGDQIGPGLFAREMLGNGRELGALDLAVALARAGYDAVALGRHELRVPREMLERYAAAMAAHGMPLVATNLRCDAAAQPFCRHLTRERLVTRGDRKIGVMATLSSRVARALPPDRLRGLEIEDELEAIAHATRRLRAAGAELVILLEQAGSSSGGTDAVYELQRALSRTLDAPDAILSTSLFEQDGDDTVRLHLSDRAPPVVGSTAGTRSLSRIELLPRWDRSGFRGARAVVRPVRADPALRDAEVARLFTAHADRFCAHFGAPVGPGKLAAPLGRVAFLDYVLAIMRKRSGAEIALIHRSFASKIAFPIDGQPRRYELERAMPYEARFGVVRLTGDEVRERLAERLGSPHLRALGLEQDGSDITINGRDLDEARTYTVAVTDFLADGGDGVLDAGDLAPAWRPGDLREQVIDFLAHHTADEDGDPGIDPETDFGAPADERTLFVATGEVGADLSDLAIHNAAHYADEPLSRNPQRSLQGLLGVRLGIRHPAHTGDIRLRLEYGVARTRSSEHEAETESESKDLASLMLLYTWIGLRELVPEAARPFVPSPYTRVLFETELTKPDVSAEQPRTWRFARITHTAGGQLAPLPSLRLRGGVGYRRELDADPRSPVPEEAHVAGTRMVAEAGAILDPVKLAGFGRGQLRLDGTADYRFLALDGEHELVVSSTLSLTIFPPIFLTASLEGFAVTRGGEALSTAFETRLGVKVLWNAAHQRL